MRVCQFRHDGKWTSIVAAAPHGPPDQEDLLSYSTGARLAVKPAPQGIPGTGSEQLRSCTNDCARIALVMEKLKC